MELRRYGTATTVFFPLIDKGATDLEATPVTIASGDCKISKDGGAFANTTTASFSHVAGGIYSIPLTATEMEAKQIIIKIVDQTATKEWEDQVIIITTCGHASSEVPYLADASVAAVKSKTDNLPSDPADASDIASATNTIAGYIDTEVAAIKAKTDLIPASPSSVSDIPTAIQVADALLKRDVDNVEATAPVHSLASAILKLVSRFKASTGVTYRTDGTTVHMTQSPTADANADPITELGAAA